MCPNEDQVEFQVIHGEAKSWLEQNLKGKNRVAVTLLLNYYRAKQRHVEEGEQGSNPL